LGKSYSLDDKDEKVPEATRQGDSKGPRRHFIVLCSSYCICSSRRSVARPDCHAETGSESPGQSHDRNFLTVGRSAFEKINHVTSPGILALKIFAESKEKKRLPSPTTSNDFPRTLPSTSLRNQSEAVSTRLFLFDVDWVDALCACVGSRHGET